MSISSDARNPVELLAEDFLDRQRRGEQPALREYLERHPEPPSWPTRSATCSRPCS
jgi:hypothetical protein